MEITVKMALHFAEPWGLTWEVESFIQMGYTPREALEEWDCLPSKEEILDYLYGESNGMIL
jgi:hypothetical protein